MSYDELLQSINADLDLLAATNAPSRQTLCFSCLKPRTDKELGECLRCHMRQCGMDDCTAACLCTLMREDDDVDE
jgi:hypothetical protein